MTPTLTRLFDRARGASTDEADFERMVEAENRLHDLFERHGEALIEALTQAHALLYPAYAQSPLERTVSALLAQLEQEAQS